MNIHYEGPLANSISLFLSHKRALGKRMEKTESVLRLLDKYLVEQKVEELDQITPIHLEGFLGSRLRRRGRSYNELLGIVRRLFDWLVSQEKLASSPLQCSPRRVSPALPPFLFSPDQVRRLFDLARQQRPHPRAPDRGETYRMIFALLYGLGLRVGEVCRLQHQDIDLDQQLLVVRKAKFGKDRLVPFGPRMAHAISDYLHRTDAHREALPAECPLFSFEPNKRRPVRPTTVSARFHDLVAKLNLTIPAGVAPPHLHCLRHSFAVETLLRWYRAGVDPMTHLFDLSTFLGHVSPSSTAVYLTITPELLACASQRFASFAAGSRKEGVR
jgi:site-specific recombinase XerD